MRQATLCTAGAIAFTFLMAFCAYSQTLNEEPNNLNVYHDRKHQANCPGRDRLAPLQNSVCARYNMPKIPATRERA